MVKTYCCLNYRGIKQKKYSSKYRPSYSVSQEYLHRTQHTVTHNRQHAGLLTQYSGKYNRMDTWPRYSKAITSHSYTLRSACTVIAVDVVDNILPSIQRAYLKHPVLFNTKTVILIGNVHSVTGQSSGHNGFLFEQRSFSKHLNSLIRGLRCLF